MGTSWISRKGRILVKGGGVDLEKGGMTPLTNYDNQNLRSKSDCKLTEDSRVKIQRSSWRICLTKKKRCQNRRLINAPCERNIRTAEKYVSSSNVGSFFLLVDNEVVSLLACYISNINKQTNLNKPSSKLKFFRK